MSSKIVKCDNKESAIQTLRGLSNTLVLVTAITAGGDQLMSIRSSAANILGANTSFHELPVLIEGEYLIESSDESSDLEYQEHALAITFNAKMSGSREVYIGNMPALMTALSDFDSIDRVGKARECKGLVSQLIVDVLNETADLVKGDDYPAGFVWVQIPSDPAEKETLISILAEHSVFFALPNVNRTLDRSNLKKGRGLDKFTT